MPSIGGTAASGPTLAQVLDLALADGAHRPGLSPAQWRVIHALRHCRTPALGGHQFRCLACGEDHFIPHSCGNRHCPQCQGAAAARWLDQQESGLLPVPYFHLVFTLPHALNGLIRQNRRLLYNLLFQAASQTLLTFGRNRFGAQVGITAVLHTWSQTLMDHYHLHCIVTGGGWDPDPGRWRAASGRYLFSIEALSTVFRAKYLAGLHQLYQRAELVFHGQLVNSATPSGFAALVRQASQKAWVVYAKRPFAGPRQVLAYLGRYTHRVAISPRRLRALDPKARTVTFDYKDYADAARHKTMTLKVDEFARRFALHILPERLVKIRHYGLLANRGRQERVTQIRALLSKPGVPAAPPDPTPVRAATAATDNTASPGVCPNCGARALVWVATLPRPKGRTLRPIDTS
jgi:hypothetical protein